jgi:hypothetical protein
MVAGLQPHFFRRLKEGFAAGQGRHLKGDQPDQLLCDVGLGRTQQIIGLPSREHLRRLAGGGRERLAQRAPAKELGRGAGSHGLLFLATGATVLGSQMSLIIAGWFVQFIKKCAESRDGLAMSLGFAVPAAASGVPSQLPSVLEAFAQHRDVLASRDELRAGQVQVAFAG